MSAADRRRQSSPIVLYHSIYLIHDDAIFHVDRLCHSFINTNIDTSAFPFRLINVIHFINSTNTTNTTTTRQL
jgi:hypothetical protein